MKRRIKIVIWCTLPILIFLFSLLILKMAVFGIFGTVFLIVVELILLICVVSALGSIGLTMLCFWLYSDLSTVDIIITYSLTVSVLPMLIIFLFRNKIISYLIKMASEDKK